MASLSWIQAAHAFNPQPDPPGFGMLGVTTGQTARLNVTLNRVANQTYPPDPFRVTLYFLNGDGRILAQQSFPVLIGDSVFLDYATPVLPAGLRQRIRPIVIIEPDASGYTPDTRQTTEVINNDTQRNAYVFPGAHNPPSNRTTVKVPANYDSGVIGITRGQVVRLNVVNTLDVYNPSAIPPDPYRVTLSFFTAEGTLLTQMTKFLSPGQAASLDVNADNFPPNQGQRLMVHAVVSGVPDINGLAPCVMPTVEGFDISNGKTSFLLLAH